MIYGSERSGRLRMTAVKIFDARGLWDYQIARSLKLDYYSIRFYSNQDFSQNFFIWSVNFYIGFSDFNCVC